MAVEAYLAGPDVFLPDARGHADRKQAICARYGILGCPPLNEDLGPLPGETIWQAIFRKDMAMMQHCDIIIANLTPFRGPSADAGTLIEVGWFLGQGKPVFAYSNAASGFAERSLLHTQSIPDPIPGLSVEGFGLPDNLMIPGAVFAAGKHPIVLPIDQRDRPFDALDVFERCVAVAAWKRGLRPSPEPIERPEEKT